MNGFKKNNAMHYNDPFLEIALENSSSIFRGINQKDKELLSEKYTLTNYRKGDMIITEGNMFRGFAFIASGKVKVFKTGVGGREQILKLVKENGFIGYRSLFADHLSPFSVAAIEPVVVITFEKSAILKVLRKYPELGIRLMKLMAEEINFMNNRIVSLTQKHIRGRVAESLLLLRDTCGVDADGKTLKVQLPREDIAHLSNMTTSNAIRTLSNLASERIIELHGRRITIINSKRLESISEMG